MWAPDEPRLLLESARAIVAALSDEAPLETSASRTVRIEALDAEDRLVRFLNEVLALAMMEGFLTADATLALDGASLSAELRGQAEASDLIVAELKSVTYHDLVVERRDGAWSVTVVIDV